MTVFTTTPCTMDIPSTGTPSGGNECGTNSGSDTAFRSMTATQRELECYKALQRLSKRYDDAVSRSLGIVAAQTPVRVANSDHYRVPMRREDRQKLGDWFQARYSYLEEAYRKAINENENIITGRQMIFDRRPRLIDTSVNDTLPSR